MNKQNFIGIWLIFMGLLTLVLSLDLNPWFWGSVTVINFFYAIILFKSKGKK